MTSKKVDPRIQRTRLTFQTALLELLKKKRFEKIQIKELAAQAGLSRHAFYSHFDTKEDLLFSYVDDLFDQIIAAFYRDFAQVEEVNLASLYTKIFELWADQAEMLQYVMQVENKDLVISRLRGHAVALLDVFLGSKDIEPTDHPMYDFILDFFTGGGYMLLRRWMKEDMTYTPQEMASLIDQLISFDPLIDETNKPFLSYK